MRRYYKLCLGIVLIPLALSALLNLIVDPLGVYHLVSIEQFNADKTRQQGTGMRIAKALNVERLQPNVLLLGTSRTEVALDPYWRGFDGLAYNAALPDTNMVEQSAMLRFAMLDAPPETLVYGLDFLAFSDEFAERHDFSWSPLSGASALDTHFKLLLSRKALGLSLKTISENFRGRVARYDDLGGIRALKFDPQGGHRRMFLDSLTPRSYSRFHYSHERFALFETVLQEAVTENISVKLYISPVHIWTLEAYKIHGLYDHFSDWKRQLTEAVERLNSQCSFGTGTCVELYDFSGYNSVTTEVVPPLNDTTRMVYYWENSHATRKVGSWVLETLFGQETEAPQDFGIRLTTDNVEAFLSEQELARSQSLPLFEHDLPFLAQHLKP